MSESFKESLLKGYGDWRRNLVLGVPIILCFFATAFIVFASMFVAALFFGLSVRDLDDKVLPDIASFIVPIAVMFAALIVCFMVDSYLVAGSTGMTLRVVREGKTTLGDMFYYGNKFFTATFLSLFYCFFACVLSAIILFLPMIIAIYLKVYSIAVGLLLLGAILYALFMSLFVFFYAITPISIASDGLGAVDALRKSFVWSSKNKLRLFLFWTTYLSICGLTDTLFSTLIGPLAYLQVLSNLLYALIAFVLFGVFMIILLSTIVPIAYVWLVRIYLGGEKSAKTARESLRRYAPQRISAQPSRRQELYI